MLYKVYILECADKTLYTGIAVDFVKRLKEHNSSDTGAKYTRARRPVKIVYFQKMKNRSMALKEEYRIKKLSRAEKLRMIKLAKITN